METEYLVKIAAGHAYSHYILGKMWGYLKGLSRKSGSKNNTI
jgi:hypothetical protein